MALVAGLELWAAWAFYRRVSRQFMPPAPFAEEDWDVHIVVAYHPGVAMSAAARGIATAGAAALVLIHWAANACIVVASELPT
eukprot:5937541-Alexandrium_andersonii.AAC.1